MIIYTYSRKTLIKLIKDNQIDFTKSNIISINSFCMEDRKNISELDEMKELLENNKDNVLFLHFDDVTEASALRVNKDEEFVRCFTPDMARKILDFADDTLLEEKQLYIHCSAGISRSGAVFLSLNDYCNLYKTYDMVNYVKNITRCEWDPHPNVTVRRILSTEIENRIGRK